MSNEKKDLTSIEDLGEFIHELEAEEEFSDYSGGLPDLPSSEESPSENNETSFESSDFGTTEESPFGSEVTESPAEDNFPAVEESSFSNNNFSIEIQEEPTFTSAEFTSPENEAPAFTEPETSEKPEEDIFSQDEAPETIPVPEPQRDYKAPETFDDLKKFSESSSFSGMAVEGNPSFSILLKNVRFIEDINDIITLLREHGLLHDPEEQIKARLMRGMLLIPRISEYTAIFLSHKLRRFDIDIQMGLSDEIHPPKHQETPETGIVSKLNLFQNQNHHFEFDDSKLEISQIIVAATPSLEGYQVLRYIGVASEHKMLDSKVIEDENSAEVPRYYQELAQKLKAHALKAHANAVVGLNYQLTPIPSEFGTGGHKYRLTCTGNLVWANKL